MTAVKRHARGKKAARSLTHQAARDLMLAFPGVEEGPCYGTPGFRVRRKFLSRFHPDGESMVLKVDMGDRDVLMRSYPDVFYITDHYRNYPSVLVRIARVEPAMLRDLFEDSWRRAAPKRLVAAYDAQG